MSSTAFQAYRTRFRRAVVHGEVCIVSTVLSTINKLKTVEYFYLGTDTDDDTDEGFDLWNEGSVLHSACLTNQVDILILLLSKLKSMLKTSGYDREMSSLFARIMSFSNRQNLTVWDVCNLLERNSLKSILVYYYPRFCSFPQLILQNSHLPYHIVSRLHQHQSQGYSNILHYLGYKWYLKKEFEWKLVALQYSYIPIVRRSFEIVSRWPYFSFLFSLCTTLILTIALHQYFIYYDTYSRKHHLKIAQTLSGLGQVVLWGVMYLLYSQPVTFAPNFKTSLLATLDQLPKEPNLHDTSDNCANQCSVAYCPAIQEYDLVLEQLVDHLHTLPHLVDTDSLSSSMMVFSQPFTSLYLCHHCYRVKAGRQDHSSHADACLPEFDHYCYFLDLDISKQTYCYFVIYLITIGCCIIPAFYCVSFEFWRSCSAGADLCWYRPWIGYFSAWLLLMWMMVMYLLGWQGYLCFQGLTSQEWRRARFLQEVRRFLPAHLSLPGHDQCLIKKDMVV